MSKTETIRARVEPGLKGRAESVLDTLGLTPTAAITLFYKQIALHGGLPFAVRIPNAATQKAMNEARAGRNLKTWRSVAALKAAFD